MRLFERIPRAFWIYLLIFRFEIEYILLLNQYFNLEQSAIDILLYNNVKVFQIVDVYIFWSSSIDGSNKSTENFYLPWVLNKYIFLSIFLFTRTWSLKSIFNIQVSFLCIFSMFRMACSVIIFGSKLHAKLQHIINGIILNNVVCIIIQKIALKRVLHSFVQTNNVIKQIWNSRRPNAKLRLCNLYFVTYTVPTHMQYN